MSVYLSIHPSLPPSPAPSLALPPSSLFFFLSFLPPSLSLSHFSCNSGHFFPVVSGPFGTSGMRLCDVFAFLGRANQLCCQPHPPLCCGPPHTTGAGGRTGSPRRLRGLSNDQGASWHPGSDALSVTDFSGFWRPMQNEVVVGAHRLGRIQGRREPAS